MVRVAALLCKMWPFNEHGFRSGSWIRVSASLHWQRESTGVNYYQERGAGVKQPLKLALCMPKSLSAWQDHTLDPIMLSLPPKATGMLWHPWIGSTDSGEQSWACSLALLAPRYFTTRYKNPWVRRLWLYSLQGEAVKGWFMLWTTKDFYCFYFFFNVTVLPLNA